MSKVWATIVKILITVVLLGYLAWNIDWRELLSEFRQVNPWAFLFAAFLYCFSVLFVTLRWQILLRVQKILLDLWLTTRLTFIGLFFNTFLLGTAGGDLSKIYYANQAVPGNKAILFLSVVSDRLIGLLVLLAFTLLMIPFQVGALLGHEDTQLIIISLVVIFVIGLAGLFVLSIFPFEKLPPRLKTLWLRVPFHDVFIKLLDGLKAHGRSKNLTISAFLLTALSFIVIYFSGTVLAAGTGLEMSFFQTSLIISIVFLVISLPISIGGHGVREGLMVILFTAFSITGRDGMEASRESAIAFSVLLFGLQLFPALIGGLVFAASGQGFRKAGEIVKLKE